MFTGGQIICLIILGGILIYFAFSKLCDTIQNITKIKAISHMTDNFNTVEKFNETIDKINGVDNKGEVKISVGGNEEED